MRHTPFPFGKYVNCFWFETLADISRPSKVLPGRAEEARIGLVFVNHLPNKTVLGSEHQRPVGLVPFWRETLDSNRICALPYFQVMLLTRLSPNAQPLPGRNTPDPHPAADPSDPEVANAPDPRHRMRDWRSCEGMLLFRESP